MPRSGAEGYCHLGLNLQEQAIFNTKSISSATAFDGKESIHRDPGWAVGSPRCSASDHLFGAHLGVKRVYATGKDFEVAGGNSGEQVVFAVEEHAVGKEIYQAAALGARVAWVFDRFAVVVDGPHGEEAGETFADEHCAEMEGECRKDASELEAEENC